MFLRMGKVKKGWGSHKPKGGGAWKGGEDDGEERISSVPSEVVAVRRRPLSKLQEEMRRKLEGGEFRQLNEKLYTSTGLSSR